ncbi:uncharacterized protein STEHIDRAFT_54031 [Stereum hirsutum FP-91666 SS1]|uniref:uncharacterized protein n=1 Tax=Stereum hirsutum (strain FP-91666) TaxID=721885 RepID=UPI000440AA80|nr:uncharacterized protein STEHIDRAFT_54031 [Stereum hirsutum FP-91666 SS1]EIM88615.1 hypothetical protein STEHIDRAFT_54031 [Stereum hirsutum FP-91666 SS1]
MAHDGLAPPLALSDILHTLSPSPAPQQFSNQPSTPRPPSPPRSPEPLNQTQIDSMRDRVLEIRGQGDNTVGLSSRETELVNMVLRLTYARIPEPSQVLEQANTIYQLTQQREFMLHEITAERSRWTAERDGFARMTEALISRHSRGKDRESSYREDVCSVSPD